MLSMSVFYNLRRLQIGEGSLKYGEIDGCFALILTYSNPEVLLALPPLLIPTYQIHPQCIRARSFFAKHGALLV